MLHEKFLACGVKDSAATILEYQFNKKTDIEKDIWYRDNDDYKATAWQKTTEVDTEDATLSGASRQGVTVSSFSQNIENTISEDTASGFLRRLSAEAAVGDYHFRDLLSRGLNIRITTTFGDGSYIRETHVCTTITDFNEPYKQLMNAESEVTLNSRLNHEPEIVNVGVGIKYPRGIQEVKVPVTYTDGTAKVTIDGDAIVDKDGLIDDSLTDTASDVKKFKVTYFEKETGQAFDGVMAYSSSNKEYTSTFNGDAGDYVAVVYYAYATEGTTIYYNAVDLKEITKS